MSKTMITLLFLSLSTLSLASDGDGPGNNTDDGPLAEEERAVRNAKVSCILNINAEDSPLRDEYEALYSEYTAGFGDFKLDYNYEVPLEVVFDEESEGQVTRYEDKYIKLSLGLYPKGLVYNQYGMALSDKKSNSEFSNFIPIWDRDWLANNKLLNRDYSGLQGRARYSNYISGDKVFYSPECKFQFL